MGGEAGSIPDRRFTLHEIRFTVVIDSRIANNASWGQGSRCRTTLNMKLETVAKEAFPELCG